VAIRVDPIIMFLRVWTASMLLLSMSCNMCVLDFVEYKCMRGKQLSFMLKRYDKYEWLM